MQTQDILEDRNVLRTVYIPVSDDHALREIAQKEGKTVSELIREACVDSFVARNES